MIRYYYDAELLGVPWIAPAIAAGTAVTTGIIGAVATRKNRKSRTRDAKKARQHEIRIARLQAEQRAIAAAEKDSRNKMLMTAIPAVVGAGLLLTGDNMKQDFSDPDLFGRDRRTRRREFRKIRRRRRAQRKAARRARREAWRAMGKGRRQAMRTQRRRKIWRSQMAAFATGPRRRRKMSRRSMMLRRLALMPTPMLRSLMSRR